MSQEPHTYASGATFGPRRDSVVRESLYPENTSQRWVLQQDKIWVDYWGNVHEIDKMEHEYKLNILCFIHRNWSDEEGWYGPLVERLHEDLAFPVWEYEVRGLDDPIEEGDRILASENELRVLSKAEIKELTGYDYDAHNFDLMPASPEEEEARARENVDTALTRFKQAVAEFLDFQRARSES